MLISNHPVAQITKSSWVNSATGEIIDVAEIRKPIGRNGFMITYVEEVMKMLDILGNRKMVVVRYIIENMDSNNILIKTIREMADELNVSTKTVNEALKALEKAEIISRRTGVIMLSPRLLHKGTEARENALLLRFYEMRVSGD